MPTAKPPGEQVDVDYRFTLANERTFLAWMRTSLALLAAGVAVVQLVPHFSVAGARTTVGVVLGVMSVLVSVGGVLRWRTVQTAMRRGLPLPTTRLTWLLAGALAVLAVIAIILLLGDG